MNKKHLYPKDWLQLHPYSSIQSSDVYFVELANRLYTVLPRTEGLPEYYRQRLCWYAAAYLEDTISGLGLWQTFVRLHQQLYGKPLPFYPTQGTGYLPDEINPDDLRFIVWNTWQKMEAAHPFLSPFDARIQLLADALYPLLETAYEEAPENERLKGFFEHPDNAKVAIDKLNWLFGSTYLTAPSMAPYLPNVKPSDRFIIPTGPLALFLHEWIEALSPFPDEWKAIEGLHPLPPEVSPQLLERNQSTFRLFTEGAGGNRIVYLDGYDALRRFLVEKLHWPDDDNHTLPHLRPYTDFILMCHPQKGILLAKDICPYIADPLNPLYNPPKAEQNAFRLLTEETLCPPDLLTYVIRHGFLPDAQLPQTGEKAFVQENLDFLARHTLLYYYRGD